jgi:16S rRNA (adenine(1408)-N(1))-methyltransferase
VGTGDGRHVLRAAAERPDTLVIGVDANAAGMAEASRKAARRNQLPNALFVVAAAERPPPGLHRLVDTLTINFPWGSLLRGVLGYDHAVLAGLASLLAPDAHTTALVSVTSRDGVRPIPDDIAGRYAGRYARHGLRLIAQRPATPDEIAAGSSWAKRLRAGAARPVTLLRTGE